MKQITFGSVCSGIEAASVAWGPLSWEAAWFAEIEPFPAAVLAHHYPSTPNLGDMTNIAARVMAGEIEAPDVLCGGTPCQAFSVAGLRQSLDDARGNLTLKFVELANAIDHVRIRAGRPPSIDFWENVPGVLSTKDNAFGCFLAGLAGEDEPLQPPGGKWSNAGAVYGPARAVAWRTLDAQYFGVAQRRRRVFVVASARNGFDPAQVLFEWDGLRRDTAPSREAGQEITPTIRAGAPNGSASHGARSGDSKDELIIPVAFGGNNQSGPIDVATARNACASASASASGRMDFETETFLVQPKVACLDASYGRLQGCSNQDANHGHSHLILHTAHTLRGEGFDASEDGTGRGTPLVPVLAGALCRDSFTGGAGGRPEGAASGHFVPAIAFPANLSGTQHASTENLAPAMGAVNPTAVAYTTKLHNTGSNNAGKIFEERTACLDANSPPPALLTAMQVRRLTPRECERLQGFRDDYTAIPWRGKPAGECPDGPRYKALGNSWAVPVVHWLGQRIQQHLARR